MRSEARGKEDGMLSESCVVQRRRPGESALPFPSAHQGGPGAVC